MTHPLIHSFVIAVSVKVIQNNQTGCSSSCVTWDEKIEKVEPKGQESDGDDVSEMLSTTYNFETQERASISVRNIDKERMIARCEPLANPRQINRVRDPMNLTFVVVAELDDLIGGLING